MDGRHRPEAVDKAVQAGKILPTLPLPEIREDETSSRETLYVKVLENPQKSFSDKFQKGEAGRAAVKDPSAERPPPRFALRRGKPSRV